MQFQTTGGAVVKHADSQHRACRSIPPCVRMKTPSVKKATGNHLVNSTSLEKIQSHVSGFCYARNQVCNAVFQTGLPFQQMNYKVSIFNAFYLNHSLVGPLLCK